MTETRSGPIYQWWLLLRPPFGLTDSVGPLPGAEQVWHEWRINDVRSNG